MKLQLYLFPLIAALASSFCVQAQDGDIMSRKINFYSSNSVILTSGVALNKSCTVTTDPVQNKIVLDQSGRLSEFIIVQHDGVWTNIAENGFITFTITYDSQPGSITVEKNDEGVFITLDMSQNPSGIKRKIIVNQIITE